MFEIPPRGSHHGAAPVGLDHLAPPGAVDGLELEVPQQADGAAHRVGVFGNQVGVAVHEGHPPSVRDHLHDVAGAEVPASVRAGPVQDGAAGEVHPGVDQRAPGQDLEGVPIPGPNGSAAGDPPPVIGVHVDRGTAERIAPLHHGAVVVRVGHGDRRDAAQLGHAGNRGVVDAGHAVPQHVSALAGHQQGPLADGEAGLGTDSGEAGDLRTHYRAVPGGDLGDGRPPLSARAHVLPIVGADRTDLGIDVVVLDPARRADGQPRAGGVARAGHRIDDGSSRFRAE